MVAVTQASYTVICYCQRFARRKMNSYYLDRALSMSSTVVNGNNSPSLSLSAEPTGTATAETVADELYS